MTLQSHRPLPTVQTPSQTGRWLLIAALLFSLTDGVLLWALPRLRLSFATGIEMLPPLAASVLTRLSLLVALAAARLIARGQVWSAGRASSAGRAWSAAGWSARHKPPAHARSENPGARTRISPALALSLALNLAFTVVQIDAYILEPQWVKTSELSLSFDRLDPQAPPVRVVHLTDIHVERYSYREATIIRKVKALEPDLIVLTGDYLNVSRLSDPTSAADFVRFVSQLEAPYGIYAVRGTMEPSPESMARLVEGTNVTWLEQETITIDIRGQQVTLVGVACSHDWRLDTVRLNQALATRHDPASGSEDTFTLLLYHSPDLIHQAVKRHIDLYLSGHTHGGQIRLPFLGPIATGSIYGRRYAAGLYHGGRTPSGGDTWMYNSRGLGLEGNGMPRVRFLCPPEIVSIELQGR